MIDKITGKEDRDYSIVGGQGETEGLIDERGTFAEDIRGGGSRESEKPVQEQESLTHQGIREPYYLPQEVLSAHQHNQ